MCERMGGKLMTKDLKLSNEKRFNPFSKRRSGMRKALLTGLVIALFLAMPVTGWAQPEINLELISSREIVEMVDGKEVRKIVPVEDAEPGQALIYTLKYRNDGDEMASNVVIDDPIPTNTSYIPGSATVKGDLSFSIDGGKTYMSPPLLTYEIVKSDGSKVKQVASPEQYTNIRWRIPEIAAGAKDEVAFQVIVK